MKRKITTILVLLILLCSSCSILKIPTVRAADTVTWTPPQWAQTTTYLPSYTINGSNYYDRSTAHMPLTYDVTGDGIQEVFLTHGYPATGPNTNNPGGCGFMGLYDQGSVWCFNGSNGAIMWSRTYQGVGDHAVMAIHDLDGDGNMELLVCGYHNTTAYRARTGQILWEEQDGKNSASYRHDKPPVVLKDKNGQIWIYTCKNSGGSTASTAGIVKRNPITGIPVTWSTAAIEHPCYGGLSAADINDDGQIEILLGDRSTGQGLSCYNATTLVQLWNFAGSIACSTQAPQIIPDQNGNGGLDIVVVNQGGSYPICIVDGKTHALLISFGSALHTSDGDAYDSAIYDIDKDGNLEHISAADGATMRVYDLVTHNLDATITNPHTGTYNYPPIICNAYGGSDMEFINQAQWYNGGMDIFDRNFTWVAFAPLGVHNSNTGEDTVVDMDNDGYNELIQFCYDDNTNHNDKVQVFHMGTSPASSPKATAKDQYYSYKRNLVAAYVQYDDPDLIPVTYLVAPKNQTINVTRKPMCTIWANDSLGHPLTINFYENSTGPLVHRQKNSGILNSIVQWNYSQANLFSKRYYWRTTIDDGNTNISRTYYFTTKTTGNITIYSYNPITTFRALPNITMPAKYLSNNIHVKTCPGEYIPATFVVRNNNNYNITVTLETQGFSWPADAINITVVKCWFQRGDFIYSNIPPTVPPGNRSKFLPELLLKNDSLVKVVGVEDYVFFNGSYHQVSHTGGAYGLNTRLNLTDTATLQPVALQTNTNKQFWITINPPNGTQAGDYSGSILIKTGGQTIGIVNLTVTVLPFTLPNPSIESSIYDTSRYASYQPGGSLRRYKSPQQLAAEFTDMKKHGITNPNVYQNYSLSEADFKIYMDARAVAGISNNRIYYPAIIVRPTTDIELLKVRINATRDYLYNNYGTTELYVYGVDEQVMDTTEMRARIDIVHQCGCKIMNALGSTKALAIADALDYVNLAYGPNWAPYGTTYTWYQYLIPLYHSYGNKVGIYAYPQCGEEKPVEYRTNYGLLLWQYDYDTVMDYAYMEGSGFLWDDWIAGSPDYYKQHVFAYPTRNGVIDTVQYEGYREGRNDLRYLQKLVSLCQLAKDEGKDVSAIEAYVANLKDWNVTTMTNVNLNQTRDEIISYTWDCYNFTSLGYLSTFNISGCVQGNKRYAVDNLNFSVTVANVDSIYLNIVTPRGEHINESLLANHSIANNSYWCNRSFSNGELPGSLHYGYPDVRYGNGTYHAYIFAKNANGSAYSSTVDFKIYPNADVNMNGYVQPSDINYITSHDWGGIGSSHYCVSDTNGNGHVQPSDISFVTSSMHGWGWSGSP
jgi:hypothetical protein